MTHSERDYLVGEELKDEKLRELTNDVPADTLLRLSEVEKLRWKKFPLLSAGFICLVDVMGLEIVKPLFPAVWEAFERYRLNATFISGPAKAVLAEMQIADGANAAGRFTVESFERAGVIACPELFKRDEETGDLKRNREREEIRATLEGLGLLRYA